MRNSFFALLLLCSLFSCSKKKIEIHANEIITTTTERLNKVKFLNSQIGFIVGGEQYSKPVMLKTLDGGITWNEVQLPLDNERKEIYGFDIFPDGKIVTVGYGGTIFISNDTGRTFQYIQHGSWRALKDVAFRNKDFSYIVGGIGFNSGHLSEFRTDGSGNNQFKTEYGFEIADIDFTDSETAYMSGYGAILKSVDGGITWDFTTAKNDFFKAMTWRNSLEGIAVGYEGSIQKTTNGGTTWKVIRNGNSITKKKVHFLDIEQNGTGTFMVVGEYGCFFVSYDYGDTWKEGEKFTTKDLRGVAFSNLENCFVVGEGGSVFKPKL